VKAAHNGNHYFAGMDYQLKHSPESPGENPAVTLKACQLCGAPQGDQTWGFYRFKAAGSQ